MWQGDGLLITGQRRQSTILYYSHGALTDRQEHGFLRQSSCVRPVRYTSLTSAQMESGESVNVPSSPTSRLPSLWARRLSPVPAEGVESTLSAGLLY